MEENKESKPKLKLGAREFKPKVKPQAAVPAGPPQLPESKFYKGVLPTPMQTAPPSIFPPGFNIGFKDGKLSLPSTLPEGLQKMFMKAYDDGKLDEWVMAQRFPNSKARHEENDLTEEEEAMVEDFLSEQKDDMEMCPFYLEGKCKYGKKWSNFHPSDIDEFSNKVNFKGDRECGICMEMTLAKDRQFGLLDGCEHAFWLDCIRNWRSTYIKRMAKDTMRCCPLCRKLSYLVIPSSIYLPGGEAKQQLFDEYQEVLGDIPCRHFNYGDGECPFLNSCFYAHYTKDGEKFDYDIKARYLNEDGEFVVEKEADHATLASLIGL